MAALFAAVGLCVLGEELLFRACSTLTPGTVVGHHSRGWPVVTFQWYGQEHRHETSGSPTEKYVVGDTVGVYVSADGPKETRLHDQGSLLFFPLWFCFLPAATLVVGGVAEVLVNGRAWRAQFEPQVEPQGHP